MALPSVVDLAAHFQLVKQIFAPEVFESAALAYAADFDWPDSAAIAPGLQIPCSQDVEGRKRSFYRLSETLPLL